MLSVRFTFFVDAVSFEFTVALILQQTIKIIMHANMKDMRDTGLKDDFFNDRGR